MSKQQIRDQLTQLVQQELDWEGDIPEGDLSLALDSVKRMSLIIAVEDHWKICFSPENDQEVRSFDDLVELIEELTGA